MRTCRKSCGRSWIPKLGRGSSSVTPAAATGSTTQNCSALCTHETWTSWNWRSPNTRRSGTTKTWLCCRHLRSTKTRLRPMTSKNRMKARWRQTKNTKVSRRNPKVNHTRKSRTSRIRQNQDRAAAGRSVRVIHRTGTRTTRSSTQLSR
uniref:(northern house mosquito) hypothetical protein n=1 Tax=Culex pipiens TaxID=7175 RepID=A0A8D8I358_CULPI